MQNVKAFHALVSSEDIGRGVTFKMAHMEPFAAGVGEHVEHIEFGFSRIEPWFARVCSVKGVPFLPKLLPFRFEFRKWKLFSSLAHWYYLVSCPRNSMYFVGVKMGVDRASVSAGRRIGVCG